MVGAAESKVCSDPSVAFQVRRVRCVIAGKEHALSVVAAQAILKEVNRLPRTSYAGR